MTWLKVFLPHIFTYQLEQLADFNCYQETIEIKPLTENWQEMLIAAIGFPAKTLPWTQLRLSLFKHGSKIQTACCCDPVMQQMTHRGAYMMGPEALQLNPNDAIRIVSQINENLMREGENLYLVDHHSWLFTSEKPLQLTSKPPYQLVGKDMFNHPYAGENSTYWTQLATEIQMLIKQMIDYQGLPQTPPETLMNVHFYDLQQLEGMTEIPFIDNQQLTIVSDNELFRELCTRTLLKNQSISNQSQVSTDHCALIAFDDEKDSYAKIVSDWLNANHYQHRQIICRDSVIEIKPKPGFFRRLLGFGQQGQKQK